MTSITPNEQKKTYKPSFGERVFDIFTYVGVNAVGTFLASALAGYCSRYGTAKPLTEWATKRLIATGVKEDAAKDAVINTALMMGGFAPLPAVSVLENNKGKIVACINDMAGAENNSEELRKQPPITISSLLKSRVLSWIAVYTGMRSFAHFVGTDSINKFEANFAENIVCKPLGVATHIAGKETRIFKLGRMAALDVFATMASTCILYCASKMFARQEQQSPVIQTPEADFSAASTVLPATDNEATEHHQTKHAHAKNTHQNFTDYVSKTNVSNLATQAAL